MTTLSLTTAKARRQIAESLAARLREAAPAAVVTVTYESEMREREVAVTVQQGAVKSWCDLSGESMWGAIVHWYIREPEGPRFADRFAAMIGGTINPHHRMKATGPFAGQGPKRGTVVADHFENMAETWVEAVRDVAEGAAGGCFLPVSVAA